MNVETKQALLTRIDAALEDIRPHLLVDGGNVELVDVTPEMVVHIKWLGTCENCSMSFITMRAGLEEAIKGRIPEIKAVEALNGIGI